MPRILVVYFSRHGSTARMADRIAEGIESVEDCAAVVRTVPPVSPDNQQTEPTVPDQGPPYATLDDLKTCDGLILGSPSYFGNMAAGLKYFLDQSSPLWISGALIGKPGGVFTASSSLHGGQESVLLSMMLPLMHHGMLICGVPYSQAALHNTSSGGTPYGPSHVAGADGRPLSDEEIATARNLGQRIAALSIKLAN